MYIIKPDACRACKHSTQLQNVPKGEPEFECRGMPPQIVAFVVPGPSGPNLQVQTTFPRVQGDWTCGQFKTRIVQAPAQQ